MFTLEVENKRGQKLKLTQDESNYQVSAIDGLTPPKAEIYTNAIAQMDGERYKASHIEMRNLVLTVVVNGDVERNRLNLYKYFNVSQMCKIYYSNNSKKVYCEGYVETIESDLFATNQTVQISIVCPDPYFYELEKIYTDITNILNNFEFPFSISENGAEISNIHLAQDILVVNEGDSPTGMVITFINKGDNLALPILYNSETRQFIKVKLWLPHNHKLVINTNRSNKSVTLFDENGVESNVIGYMDTSATWLQLDVGLNYFRLTNNDDVNNENISCTIEHSNRFLGV